MIDKYLNIWLIVLFGISGIAVLLLAWLGLMADSDKILAALLGSIGLLVASNRALMLRHSSGGTDDEPFPVKVETKNKS